MMVMLILLALETCLVLIMVGWLWHQRGGGRLAQTRAALERALTLAVEQDETLGRMAMRALRRGDALREIAALETPKAASTVRKAVAIARKGLAT